MEGIRPLAFGGPGQLALEDAPDTLRPGLEQVLVHVEAPAASGRLTATGPSMLMLAGYVAFTLSLALSQPGAGAADHVTEKGPGARASAASSQETSTMKIRLTINGTTIPASLSDNATARDFLALLPLTLTLEDYAATEKIAYLPRKLSTAGAPAGFDPSIGDITYYAPWGNLAIFHKDFGYSEGLVHLGRVDSGIEALKTHGALRATIERIEK